MTKATLLDFQKTAVQTLANKMTKNWVNSFTNKNYATQNPIVLSSPTGSGKTIMVTDMMQTFKSRTLELLVEKNYSTDENAQKIIENFDDFDPLFVFLSPSTGSLDRQSFNRIKSEGSMVQNSDSEVLLNVEHWDDVVSTGEFEPNTVIVLSWDKVNRVTNRSRSGGEDLTTSFDMIIRKTRKNSPIIMFIDESHKNDTKKSKEIIDAFKPDVLVKVSATPKESAIATGQNSSENAVLVSIEDARKAKLIKDSISIITHNNGKLFTKKSVIENAVKMQIKLEEALIDEKMSQRYEVPLVLIQIENDKHDDTSNKSNATLAKEHLMQLGINPRDIAVWLTDKAGVGKENVYLNDPDYPEKIPKNIKYLIFKTAVATGWDCPRAHILVKLRNVGSVTLDIQTMGRIARKANNKVGLLDDYTNAILKPAYIFIENGISVADFSADVAGLFGNYISENSEIGTIKPKFRAGVEKFNSIGLQKETMIPSGSEEENLNNQELNSKVKKSLKKAIEDSHVPLIFDSEAHIQVSSGSESIAISEFYKGTQDLEQVSVTFGTDNDARDYFFTTLENLLNEKKLFSTIKDTFKGKSRAKNQVNEVKVDNFIKMLLGELTLVNLFSEKNMELTEKLGIAFFINNVKLFENFAISLTEDYNSIVHSEILPTPMDYSIPETLNVKRPNYVVSENYLYDVEPSFENESNIEEAFSNYLRENINVKWWFKNSVGGTDGLGIYYLDDTQGGAKYKGYYPDFILETVSGEIYILDTKEGTIDNSVKLKYKQGLEFKKSMQSKVISKGYPSLSVNMVTRTSRGDFQVISGFNHTNPTESSAEWSNINF